MGDYPCTAQELADILHLKKRHENAICMDFDCPFCGKMGKLNIHIEKGVYRCNYCDKYGNLITLYAELMNKDTKEAYREICELLHCGSVVLNYKRKDIQAQKKQSVQTVECADLEIRHKTYSELLELLTLTEQNKNHLLQRGLTLEQIKECGFKSTPTSRLKEITAELIRRGCILEGVPGFFMTRDGTWMVNFSKYCTGILIPVLSFNKKIQGFQIRLNKPFADGKKYIWFSSISYYKGSSVGAPVHFIGSLENRSVYVTEGSLKATVAHYLFEGRTFVAIAGASQYQKLTEYMMLFKKYHVKLFVEAMDIDKFKNMHVMKGCLSLKHIIEQNHFPLIHLAWNTAYKGIDDCIYMKKVQQQKGIQFKNYDIDTYAKKCLGQKEYEEFIYGLDKRIGNEAKYN